jgi:hypothetical protein
MTCEDFSSLAETTEPVEALDRPRAQGMPLGVAEVHDRCNHVQDTMGGRLGSYGILDVDVDSHVELSPYLPSTTAEDGNNWDDNSGWHECSPEIDSVGTNGSTTRDLSTERNAESQQLVEADQTRTGSEMLPSPAQLQATAQPQPYSNLASHLSATAGSASVAYLMGHYRDIAGTLFSPRSTKRLPWVVMHLPAASSTLRKIASGERPKFVQTAFLNAVLSVSAFNLDKMNISKDRPSDLWWVLGQSFRSHGKRDIQRHLALELSDPDSTEYMETLMALLTMATASVSLTYQKTKGLLLMKL